MNIDLKKLPAKYSFKNKSFIVKDKDDWKDRIDIEVGDIKQPDKFYPQIKVSRWDNESNISLRLLDYDIEDNQVSIVNEKVLVDHSKINIEYHSVDSNDKYPDGGFEFNIILKEKPTTNILEFSINIKDAVFYYQDILKDFNNPNPATPIDSNSLHVHGSYAIYAVSKKINIKGGKVYKSGKIGHIYKPLIEDSSGKNIYGELNYDSNRKVLQVIIPKEFLNNAIYPVKHATGLTFGYTSIGASTTNTPSSDIFATKGTSTSAGTADSVSFYAKKFKVNSNVKGITVNSSKNIITNGISPAVSVNSSTAQWWVSTYSTSPSISGSSTYWASFITQGGIVIYRDVGSSGDGFIDTSNDYTTPTAPTDATENTNLYSIYVTYSIGANIITSPNSSKASIVVTNNKNNSAKSNIITTYYCGHTYDWNIDGQNRGKQ